MILGNYYRCVCSVSKELDYTKGIMQIMLGDDDLHNSFMCHAVLLLPKVNA